MEVLKLCVLLFFVVVAARLILNGIAARSCSCCDGAMEPVYSVSKLSSVYKCNVCGYERMQRNG